MEIKFNNRKFQADINKMINKLERSNRKVDRTVVSIMKGAVKKVEEETVKRMPIDEGFLEKSTKTKVVQSSNYLDTTGYVFIPANAPASGYALAMHEWRYNLGPKSRKKQANSDVRIGRKYMQRAFNESARAVRLYFVTRLRRLFK